MKTIFSIFTALFPLAAYAETYYVDATNGRDTNNGKAETASPNNHGPWQTLQKLTTATLLPGDKVLLKCGETWRETLRINASGTASQPITLSSYPSRCDKKPLIDGSLPVPAESWSYHADGIYKATFTADPTYTSTFSGSLNGWTKYSANQDGMLLMSNRCEVSNDTCARFISGWGTGYYNSLRSPNISLTAGAGYELSFSIKAPNGVVIRPTIRRASRPYETLGLNGSITGNGNWTRHRLTFVASATLNDARIELDVPTGFVDISLDNVKLSPTLTIKEVTGLFSEGRAVNIAHHPKRGHNPQQPTSLYLTIAENADRVTDSGGRTVSTYLTTGPDLQLPAGASLTTGTGIRVRVNAWMIDDRKVAATAGTRITFDKPTSYPVEKGWGYYLYGQRWMLDEPGEWHYDPVLGELYIRMPDDQAPGDRVSVAHKDVGVDVSNRSHVVIDGLAIRNVTTGVNMRNTTNVAVSNASIQDTLGKGVDALQSTDGSVTNSRIERTAGDAIWAANGPNSSWRLRVTQNMIQESGARYTGNNIANLPIKNEAAIMLGDDSTASGNTIIGGGYIGIRAFSRGLINNNLIQSVCSVLDDCGAIYVNGPNNASLIQNNIIRNIPGAADGKPTGHGTQGQGIMLDDLSSQVSIQNNTIIDADNGIQLHNAALNIVQNNVLYGNRKSQLWFQEQTNTLRTAGDLYDNFILGNQYFPLQSAIYPSLLLQSSIKTTAAFAAFDDNVYSTLLNPTMAKENWPGGETMHTFTAWQSARTADGVKRYLDPNGREIRRTGHAAYRATGDNIVVNGDLHLGTSGWSTWNQIAPYGTLRWEPCAIGYCVHYTAGASASLLISPNFTVLKDNWYRVSFDYKTGSANQIVSVLVRRGGGGQNNYEALAGSDEKVVGSIGWKRHSYTFKALKTVNEKDPVTLDNGARVDFQNLMPGQSISVANLEVVPITAIESTLRIHALTNPSDNPLYENCPDWQTDSALCDQYVRFTNGSPVTWPLAISPWSAEIIYTRDETLIDADADGIADSQDLCPTTPAGQAVNARGCALSQSYP